LAPTASALPTARIGTEGVDMVRIKPKCIFDVFLNAMLGVLVLNTENMCMKREDVTSK